MAMGIDPNDYQRWLEEADVEDTKENKGWYDCPDEDKSDYIRDNPEWWKNF